MIFNIYIIVYANYYINIYMEKANRFTSRTSTKNYTRFRMPHVTRTRFCKAGFRIR